MRSAQATQSTSLGSQYNYLLGKHSQIGRLAKWIFRWHCRFVMSWYTPLTVEGAENLPQGQSYILCSNHNSHIDSAVLMVVTKKRFRDCAMVAAKDYFFDHRWRRVLSTLFMNLIPLDRKASPTRGGLDEYFEVCRQFCQQGARAIIIYPEGTRSQTGEMATFKKGPSILAAQLGLPLVPAHIDGTYKCWRKGQLWIRPGKMHVRVGQPIDPASYGPIDVDDRKGNIQIYKKITEDLEQQVRNLAIRKIKDAKR
ncbi:MAG: lysophospholipid acyltransferase family protein [Bdellovibrionota bacterium]|nr:1-acyl-sn-glycerol-3-phosphate acyltransferase [Deltaproteobacteria bacterium]